MLVAGIVVLVALCTTVTMTLFLLRNSRASYVATLGPAARDGLLRLTRGTFEGAPVSSIDPDGTIAVEGERHGERFVVRARFGPASGRYIRTGYLTGISAEIKVVVGLRGARPKLSLVRTGEPLEDSFDRRWKGDVDDGLLDDETKTAIMDWLAHGPRGQSISVGPEGLCLAFEGDAGARAHIDPSLSAESNAIADAAQAKDLELSIDLAHRLQKRILDVLGRRVDGPKVRVAAYREGSAVDAEEEEAERRAAN